MSKGFLVVAQNNIDYDFRVPPKHTLLPQYEGIHVDVWYQKLSYIKGQHIYKDRAVYKVDQTSSLNTKFNDLHLTKIISNILLIDDENSYLTYYRAHKNDLVLSNNKIYTVDVEDDVIPYDLQSIYKGIHVDIHYEGLEYIKGQHVFVNNTVYRMFEDSVTIDNTTAELILPNVKLYEDNNKSLVFEDAKAGDNILFFNHLYELKPIVFDDYVKQACYLAASLHKFNPNEKISILTNDTIPNEYKNLFDHIIPIPYGDDAANTSWKVENRWKVYHCTPYDETVVLDTDMLFLQDISEWWNYFNKYDLYFTTNVKTYRNKIASSDTYRKAFTSNNLPNIYTGMYYFKKTNLADKFFDMLELICKNWELFYNNFLPNNTPPNLSIDVAAALAVLILDIENKVSNKQNTEITFVHMKPYIQDWIHVTNSWQDSVGVYLDMDCKLKLGNHLQSGIFHYTEKNFLKNIDIERLLNVS